MDTFDPFFGTQLASPKVQVTPSDPVIKFTQELTDEIDTAAVGYDADDYSTIATIVL